MLKTKENVVSWLNQYNIKNYTINEDLSVDVHESVMLVGINLVELPIMFNTVNGFFNCSFNSLTNLLGCPKIVKGNFNCSFNHLKSLENGPEEVSGDYLCVNNKIENLESNTKKISGNIYIFNNPLINYSRFNTLYFGYMYLDKVLETEKIMAEYIQKSGRIVIDYQKLNTLILKGSLGALLKIGISKYNKIFKL